MDAIILDLGQDLRGDATLPGFEGKVELLSFAHGIAQPITGDPRSRERASGRALHQEMTVTKYLDRASPLLNLSCCEARVFPQADIVLVRSDGGSVVELMRYTLKNVIISVVSVGGGGGGMPVESLALNYEQIIWKYTPQADGGGAVRAGWNLATDSAP